MADVSFIAIFRRVLLFLINKVLKWLLPIPLFPAVSSVLANMVGINPLTLNNFSLQKLPTISLIPPVPIHLPTVRGIEAEAEHILSETIPLGEKVQTWRQRHLVPENVTSDAEDILHLAEKITKKSLGNGKQKRERIDHIDFDNPLGRVEKAIPDVKSAVQDVLPHAVAIPQVPDPQPSTSEPKVEQDVHRGYVVPTPGDFDRLSAEKQVYEQAQSGGLSDPLPIVKPPSPFTRPDVQQKYPSPPSTTSSPASMILAPISGEVSVIPAPKILPSLGAVEPYSSLKDMHITGPKGLFTNPEKKKPDAKGARAHKELKLLNLLPGISSDE